LERYPETSVKVYKQLKNNLFPKENTLGWKFADAPELRDFLRKLLTFDPEERLTVT